jgi:hypothetical protein
MTVANLTRESVSQSALCSKEEVRPSLDTTDSVPHQPSSTVQTVQYNIEAHACNSRTHNSKVGLKPLLEIIG